MCYFKLRAHNKALLLLAEAVPVKWLKGTGSDTDSHVCCIYHCAPPIPMQPLVFTPLLVY